MSNAKDVAVRLQDYAAQEGCDGEPYDTMQEGAQRIRELEAENVTYRNAQKACETCDGPTIAEFKEMKAALEQVRELKPIRVATANITMLDDELVFRADELAAILAKRVKEEGK
jgi:hypothetical protein